MKVSNSNKTLVVLVIDVSNIYSPRFRLISSKKLLGRACSVQQYLYVEYGIRDMVNNF